jgi:hypothetical protein
MRCTKRGFFIAVLSCGLAFLAITLIVYNTTNGLSVSVINQSNEPLTEVSIAFSDRKLVIGNLGTGRSSKHLVMIGGDSGLRIHYHDSAGAHIHEPDVYLSRGDTGAIEIVFTDLELKLTVVQRTFFLGAQRRSEQVIRRARPSDDQNGRRATGDR